MTIDSGDSQHHGSTWYDYLTDQQGSVMGILKQDGTTAAAYSYSDFGETIARFGETFDNEICYTGAVYDRDFGEYYLNARYYDPATARFLSQDTYRGNTGDYGQWNLYAYCANDPINCIDLSGHFVTCIGVKAEAAVIVGGFISYSLCYDGKVIAICRSIGGVVATAAEASFSVFSNYYKKKNSVSQLAGWGYSAGITFCWGLYLSKSYIIEISSNGSIDVIDQGAVGIGNACPKAYWSVSVGKTKILKKWNVASIGKKSKSYRYKSIKVKANRKKKDVIVRMNKRRVQMLVTKGKAVKVDNY